MKSKDETKQRIISAVVALGIIIPVIIIGGNIYNLTVVLIAFFGMKELIDMVDKKEKFPILVQMFAYIGLLFFLLNNIINTTSNIFILNIDYRVIASILLMLLVPLIFYHNDKKYNVKDALFLTGIIFFLGMAFNLLILIRDYDITYLIFLLFITLTTDTYAYTTGMLIGKHRLLASPSPNKSIEGIIGGSIIGTLAGTLFYYEMISTDVAIWLLILIVLFLSIIGQTGDLIFSAIKRYYGKKDFSNIMPGHGGILDRLDSIIFVLLTFVLFVGIL
ncbi:MAG: phosphatidate cytidylyltransferase [Bacilli bacterium]